MFVHIFTFRSLEAWDDKKTHPVISEQAVKNSILAFEHGDYLKNLGFKKSLGEEFKWETFGKDGILDPNFDVGVTKWVQEGSRLEDTHRVKFGPARQDRALLKHFHDPLLDWGFAGLDTILIFPEEGQSSVLWAMDDNNDWSWQKVREYYYNALTFSDPDIRDTNFAKTFRGVGQLIHLIQDVSQPAHVRNDPHPFDALRWRNGFETWAINNADKVDFFMQNPVFPPDSLLASGRGFPTPITELFDTKQFAVHGNPPDESNDAGLAEYTNVNFFSEDRIFSSYPWPSIDPSNATKVSEKPIRRFQSTITRSYYKKTCNTCGETNGGSGYLLAAESITEKYIRGSGTQTEIVTLLDDKVYEDYAKLLFPRAVGYSTALINYFFRGEMEVTVADDGSTILKNTSNEDMKNGEFKLCYDTIAGTRSCNSLSVDSLLKGASRTFQFQKGLEYKMAVYKGDLGGEVGAVIGKFIGTPEPDTGNNPCAGISGFNLVAASRLLFFEKNIIDCDTEITGDIPRGINIEVIDGADLIINGTMEGTLIAGFTRIGNSPPDLRKKSNVTLKGDVIGIGVFGGGFEIRINGNLTAPDSDFINSRVSVTGNMTFRNLEIERDILKYSVITVDGDATGVDVFGVDLSIFGSSGKVDSIFGGRLSLGSETNFTTESISSVISRGGNNITAKNASDLELNSNPFLRTNGDLSVERFGDDNDILGVEGNIITLTSFGSSGVYATTGASSEIRGLYSGNLNWFRGAAGGLTIASAHTNTNTDGVTGIVTITNSNVDTDPTLPPPPP